MISFTAPLDPMPARRPRVVNRTAYNDPKYTAFKAALATYARRAMQGKKPLAGELQLAVDLYRKFPPASRRYGDADNHLKSIMDALNGICYDDDAQIICGSFTKNHGEPHIDIRLEMIT